ncbi:serine/threonine-protein kinase MAK-like [Oppia nitens]|uniref:serine/threonine-protein kinase MAK-like n=1 Tax=Oppia nitens TaxID=1686743 RepID=UPI0023DCD8ED|nr:serine/threonine-protein kinase MAK-like [Oppia nitens]
MAGPSTGQVVSDEERHLLSQNGYDIGPTLGSGRMGVVYKGVCNDRAYKFYPNQGLEPVVNARTFTDNENNVYIERSLSGKLCAIKRLKEPMSRSGMDEAQHLVLLNHPNIVEFYTTLTLMGHQYIVLEYLNGGSLADCLREMQRKNRRFVDWQVSSIYRQLLFGLQFAHQNNIIHKDLQFGNIMFHIPDSRQPDRRVVKLVDFGAAEESTTKTRGRGVTETSDIWRLAPAFRAILNQSIIRTPGTEQQLRTIVAKMDEKRYVNIEQVLTELQPVLDQMPPEPTQETGLTRASVMERLLYRFHRQQRQQK